MSPVTKVGSRWSSGDLIFYEKDVSLGAIANILTIGDDAVTVGSTTNDIDFKWYGTGSVSFILDVGDSSMTLVGCNVSVDGDIEIGSDDIALDQGYFIYFEGLGSTTNIRAGAVGYLDLEAATAIRPGIDLQTDRWLSSVTNTLIGMDVAGADALSHAAGNTGWHNTAIGAGALKYNTTGGENSVFGSAAGALNNTGAQNSAFGSYTLYTNTGSNNTAFGAYALFANTTGAGNIALGRGAGDNITTADYCIIIGYGIDAPSVSVDAQLQIGGSAGMGYILGDQTGDMTINALSGKTVNLAVNGTDELAVDGSTVTLATNNLTLTAGDIAVATGKHYYFGGQGATAYLMSNVAGLLTLVAPDPRTDAFSIYANTYINGEVRFNDLAMFETDKRLYFRDTSVYLVANLAGKLTVVTSSLLDDAIYLYGNTRVHGTFTTDNTVTIESNSRLNFRDTTSYIVSNLAGKLTVVTSSALDDAIYLYGNTRINGTFVADDDATIETDKRLYFRDSNTYVHSRGVGQMNIYASDTGESAIYLIGNTDINGTFKVNDDVTIRTDKRLYFRDSNTYIHSRGVGQMNIVANDPYEAAIYLIGNVAVGGKVLLQNTTVDGTIDGQIWYDTASNHIQGRANGSTVDLH